MSSCRYSSDANADIEEIVLYLFDLNPVAAHNFLNALEETCGLLAGHPLLGRLRPELGEGVRSFPVGNYLIFYAAAPHGIGVARVIYGGRDLPNAFGR
jgi:toxin ParE1/3/4